MEVSGQLEYNLFSEQFSVFLIGPLLSLRMRDQVP